MSDQLETVKGKKAELKISQTLSDQLAQYFTLGWSHYITLLTIDSVKERKFYEIEATRIAGASVS